MEERRRASVGSRMIKRKPRKRVVLNANCGLGGSLCELMILGLDKPSPNGCRWSGAAGDHHRYDLVKDKGRHRLRSLIQQA